MTLQNNIPTYDRNTFSTKMITKQGSNVLFTDACPVQTENAQVPYWIDQEFTIAEMFIPESTLARHFMVRLHFFSGISMEMQFMDFLQKYIPIDTTPVIIPSFKSSVALWLASRDCILDMNNEINAERIGNGSIVDIKV
jgi:hypothetical protein